GADRKIKDRDLLEGPRGYRSALPEAHEYRAADSGQCADFALSAKLPSFVKDGGRKVRAFSDVFKIFARSFKQREQHFKLLRASQGGAIKRSTTKSTMKR